MKCLMVMLSFHNKLINLLEEININQIFSVIMHFHLTFLPFSWLLFIRLKVLSSSARRLHIRKFQSRLPHKSQILSKIGRGLQLEFSDTIAVNGRGLANFGVHYWREQISVVFGLEDVLHGLASTIATQFSSLCHMS